MSALTDLQRTLGVIERVRSLGHQTTAAHAYNVARRHRSIELATLEILTERNTVEELLDLIREKAKYNLSPTTKKRCCICLKRERAFVVAPCGHYNICGVCIHNPKLKNCPSCRKFIVHRIKVYE